jgi:chaperonin cofactor prefoldin
MPEWQKSELQKRYMQYQQGELELHDWQDVHEELRRTY